MTVWGLLWELLKHALSGRGRDEVHLQVTRAGELISAPLGGQLEDFTCPPPHPPGDNFCVLLATDHDHAHPTKGTPS